jgi:hypothetical protein
VADSLEDCGVVVRGIQDVEAGELNQKYGDWNLLHTDKPLSKRVMK